MDGQTWRVGYELVRHVLNVWVKKVVRLTRMTVTQEINAAHGRHRSNS